MADVHHRSMEEAMRSLIIDESASFRAHDWSRLGKSIFTWKPIIIEPKRPKVFDHIWFNEAAELHYEGMVIPITDLKYKL